MDPISPIAISLALESVADLYLRLNVLSLDEHRRIRLALSRLQEPPSLRSLSKIDRATALGLFKMLLAILKAAAAADTRNSLHLDYVLQDAMARNAAQHEFEMEDRGC